MDELREAFEQAYEKAETEAATQATDEATETAESEKFAEIGEEKFEQQAQEEPSPEPNTEQHAEPQKDDPEPTEVSHETNETKVANNDIKAPSSWSAKSRESWANVPPEAQAEIAKRENEITQTLHQTATARQMAVKLNETLSPYRESLMGAGYQDPFQAVSTVLQTEAALRTGSHTQKAQTIARLINDYGVDIEALDNELSVGPQQPRQGGNPDIERIIDQRMAPFNQYVQQQQYAQQQYAQQQQEEASRAVSEFSQNAEFINDVRNDMADLLDMAASRNQKMTIQEAYDKACALNPEICQILENRQKQQQINNQNQQVRQKKQAAASITGQRGGSRTSTQDMTMRDSIRAAWDDLESV